MLYTKPINDITFQDVQDFCEQKTPENFRLDYKRKLPSSEKLAKLISAFANTYGGVIVVGINAPKGTPNKPYEGMEYDESLKYEEKIQSIIISHITEPVFPEIQVCTNQNKKAFIIIRVPESENTPHRVGNDSKVYIRTGEINTSTEEAPWGKIEWLMSRRTKSIELRNYIIDEADVFFKESFYRYNIDIDKYFGIVSLRILPLFPQGQLVHYENLMDIENKIKVGYDNIRFPECPITLDCIQNGAQKLYFTYMENNNNPKQDEPFFFMHLTNLGIFLYKWDAGVLEPIVDIKGKKVSDKKGLLNFFLITERLLLYLTSASKFYKHIGFWGALLFEIEFNNVLGLSTPHLHEYLRIPRSYMKWSRKFLVSELDNNKNDIVLEIMTDIVWSLGFRINYKDELEDYITKKKLDS